MKNKTELTTYTVRWEIELDANSHEEAAKKALEIMQDKDSIATVFEVEEWGGCGELKTIDVAPDPEA